MPRVLAIVLDVASVLVFAAIGRLSHGESLDATQLGRTAAPFLAATLMVWVAMIMKPFLESSSRQGLAVWAVTLVLGMSFMLINFAIDIVYGILDPRVRLSGRGHA